MLIRLTREEKGKPMWNSVTNKQKRHLEDLRNMHPQLYAIVKAQLGIQGEPSTSQEANDLIIKMVEILGNY